MTPNLEEALRIFSVATSYVVSSGQCLEIEWQRRVTLDQFTETDLLRESAWVILCSGFRERVVRRVFDHISLCFCDWESATAILAAYPTCCNTALASFRSPSKIGAIVNAASYINEHGFAALKDAVLIAPLTELQRLPHIGPITVWHLAKNLGLNVAKPDRHLVRVSLALGFENVEHFCGEIANSVGEKKKVVDLIIWRYLADHPHAFYDLGSPRHSQPL